MNRSPFNNILGVVPARLGSTRLPSKVLALIDGKPMAWWVWKRASRILPRVVVATDHVSVKTALEALGTPVVMTSPKCPSGTDRVAAVARQIKTPFYMNIQGDEPLIPPATVKAVATLMMKKRRGLFSAASPMPTRDGRNPNIVKVAIARDRRALYFSRSPIPFSRDGETRLFRHSGIYGYDRRTLFQMTSLDPSPLEKCERLEQLRALESGIPVWMAKVVHSSPAVDTAGDLTRVRQHVRRHVRR